MNTPNTDLFALLVRLLAEQEGVNIEYEKETQHEH